MKVLLQWCPPYLWPGHHIEYFTISTTNITDGTITYDRINATFDEYVMTFEKERQGEVCGKLKFTLSAVNTDSENLQTYEITKGYEQG